MKLQSLADLPHPRDVGSSEYRAIIETILDVTDDVAEAREIAIEFRGHAQAVIDRIDGTETPPPADLVTAARAALQACRTELEVRGADNDHVYAYPMAPVVRGLEEALDNPGPVSPPPPQDSEPSNQDRAARAREILESYARKNAPEDSLESNLGDLLADFRHLCAQGLEMDFEQASLMSEAHFAEESEEG